MPENGDQPKGQRVYIIEPEIIETPEGPVQNDELEVGYLAQRLTELAPILCRIGGSFHIGALRTEVEPGIFVTEKAVIRWNSFMPARRQARPPAPPANGATAEEEVPNDVEYEIDDSAAAPLLQE